MATEPSEKTKKVRHRFTRQCIDCGCAFYTKAHFIYRRCVSCRPKAVEKARQDFKEKVKANWEEVTAFGGHVRQPFKWTEGAIYCLLTNKDCFNCTVSRIQGWWWGDGCHMPTSVQALLDRGEEIPARLIESEMFTETTEETE